MKAGPLRHRCSLQEQTRIPDGYGGYSQGWANVREVWAEITMPTGRTALVAQQLKAEVTAEIRVRLQVSVKVGQRLAYRDETYSIEARLADNDRSMLRLLCSSVPNP